MAKQDFYALLGVDRGASDAALISAYDSAVAALLQRPDAQGDDVQNRLKFLRFARETLLNTGRRAAYDASLHKSAAPLAAPAPAAPAGLPRPVALAVVFVVVVAAATVWYVRSQNQLRAASVPAPLPVAVVAAAPAAAEPARADVPATLTAGELFERNAPSVVVIVGLNGEGNPMLQGSGVVVADGRVITNCHVAKSAASTLVRQNGKNYRATLLRIDPEPKHDLCLLEVEGLHSPSIALATKQSIKVGNKVFALGAPKGLELTLSEGIVSSLREYDDSHFVQTTASISPGSSGGGLFDTTGALIGITTFQSTEGQNLNFAVPVDWVARILGRIDKMVVLGAEALSDLQGSWQCDASSGSQSILYRFGSDGVVGISRAETPGKVMTGTYSITGNHTLVLKNPNANPQEIYAQIMSLSRSELRMSSPFYQDAQTYQCRKTGR